MTGLRNATILSLLVSTMFLGTACGGTQAAGNGQDGGSTHSDGGGTGGGSDGGVQQPKVTITAPTDGATYAAGTSITFTGSATDPVDGALTGKALSWTSDKDGALGLGATVTTALTTAGAQTITLTATDSAGHSASASISLTITAANVPQVTITSPTNGQQAAIGEPIQFTATVKAPAGAKVSNANIIWTSSLDGQIGIGSTVRTGLATAGTHTITCTATDSNGKVGSATVSVDVVNHKAPVVKINTPADGSYFRPTDSISFTGTATAAAGSTIAPRSLVWKDQNVQIGIGATVTTALPLGDHTVTFSATDNTGAIGEATITIHVVKNLPPVCTIFKPQDGQGFLTGQTITFQGSCTDPDSAQPPTNLTWSSDVDGQLGLGATVQTALGTTGDRVVSLCATDPVDPTITGCSTVTIHVNANTPPACTINAPQNGAIVQVGDQVVLNGTITDAEDPSITGLQPTAKWTDDLGNALGTQAQTHTVFTVAQAGTRTLTLTGTDSGGLTCTATVTVLVNQRPTATITSMSQGGSTTQPFNGNTPVDFTGTGTDPDGNPLTFTWADSYAGAFGTGTSASLATPSVGHHTVYLTADDGNGGLGVATRSFTVMPPNGGNLVQPFIFYNTQGRDLRTLSLATDSTGMLSVGNHSTQIWRQDGTNTSAGPTLNDGNLPDNANTIVLDEAGGRVLIGTQGSGYLVCSYNTTTGINSASCQRYQGQDLPSDTIYAIASLTGSNGQPMLVVGTRGGLFIPQNAQGSSRGQRFLRGDDIRGIAVDGSSVWVATRGNGLYHLDPALLAAGGSGMLGHWGRADGAPSDNLYAVALGTQGDAVWVGSDQGLGRFSKTATTWSTWVQVPVPGLAANTVMALAIDHPTIGGLARDVIWCGTTGGVSRFDPTIPSFMNLTTADGLPSNQVNAIVVLPNGTKIFGTQNGLARYTGK